MIFDIFLIIIGFAIMPFAIIGFVMVIVLAITIITTIVSLLLAILGLIAEFIKGLIE